MPRAIRLCAVGLALCTGLLLAACDIASPARDADTLLADARLAREGGDLTEAIALLEQALALEPAHAGVRVELSSAYLQRAGIDLLDVDRLLRFPGPRPPAAPNQMARAGAACVFEDDPDASPFSLRDAEGYAALAEERAAVADALALLHESPAGARPVMPAAL